MSRKPNVARALEDYARALEGPEQRMLRLAMYRARQRRYTNFLLTIGVAILAWRTFR